MKRMNFEDRAAELRQQTNLSGVQFVFIELELALSFLDIANNIQDPERRQRLFANARKAYSTVQGFIPRLTFSTSEASIVDRKLGEIRGHLEHRGFGSDDHIAAAP